MRRYLLLRARPERGPWHDSAPRILDRGTPWHPSAFIRSARAGAPVGAGRALLGALRLCPAGLEAAGPLPGAAGGCWGLLGDVLLLDLRRLPAGALRSSFLAPLVVRCFPSTICSG